MFEGLWIVVFKNISLSLSLPPPKKKLNNISQILILINLKKLKKLDLNLDFPLKPKLISELFHHSCKKLKVRAFLRASPPSFWIIWCKRNHLKDPSGGFEKAVKTVLERKKLYSNKSPCKKQQQRKNHQNIENKQIISKTKKTKNIQNHRGDLLVISLPPSHRSGRQIAGLLMFGGLVLAQQILHVVLEASDFLRKRSCGEKGW